MRTEDHNPLKLNNDERVNTLLVLQNLLFADNTLKGFVLFKGSKLSYFVS